MKKPNTVPKAQAYKKTYQQTDEHLRMKKGGKVKKGTKK